MPLRAILKDTGFGGIYAKKNGENCAIFVYSPDDSCCRDCNNLPDHRAVYREPYFHEL